MKKSIFVLVSSIMLLSACNSTTTTQPQPSASASSVPSTPTESPTNGNTTKVQFVQVKTIIEQRCATCHSATSVDNSFGNMPGGVSYDTAELIKANANRIKARAVISKDMPKFNKTNITEEERTLLGRWVDEGATIN
ncbi:hypothetical protein EON78_02780 [bacterium]|nr:MAG: hypothetical protein EON78_02780 [bacterium]